MQTSTHMGIARIMIEPVNFSVVSTFGVGLVLGPNFSTWGVMSEKMIIVPDSSRCMMVFLENTESQIKSTIDFFRLNGVNFNKLCFIK